MGKVFMGMALMIAISFTAVVSAQDSNAKKDTPQTETTKNESTCCSAPASAEAKTTTNAATATKTASKANATAEAKTCCSATASAATKTCCSATASAAPKCSQQSVCISSCKNKDCSQVEKIIADKKTEAKKKN